MPLYLDTFDLNLLVPLSALLREQSVTKAAERVSITQPSMSASLARLRKHFDDELLVKEGGRMGLTPLAESLVQPVAEILAGARAVAAINEPFNAPTSHTTFTVAASDYTTAVLLRPLLRELGDLAPNVQINVVSLQHDDVVGKLRRRQYDLLVCPTTVPTMDFNAFPSERLFTDRWIAAVDQDNPEVGDLLTTRQLPTLPYLQPLSTQISIVEMRLDHLDITRRVTGRADSFFGGMCLMPDTHMFTVVPERLLDLLGPGLGLRPAVLEAEVPDVVQAMYWDPRNTNDPALQWLRQQIAQIATTLRTQGRPHSAS